MALIKCPECGKQISDQAEACPKCGCPIEPKTYCPECKKEISTDEAKALTEFYKKDTQKLIMELRKEESLLKKVT